MRLRTCFLHEYKPPASCDQELADPMECASHACVVVSTSGAVEVQVGNIAVWNRQEVAQEGCPWLIVNPLGLTPPHNVISAILRRESRRGSNSYPPTTLGIRSLVERERDACGQRACSLTVPNLVG
jgi:hypothetical protein